MPADWKQRTSKITELLSSMHKNAVVHEPAFSSSTPLIGRLIVRVREMWNSVSTKWYVRPMLLQQNRFNVNVTQAVQELASAIGDLSTHLERLATHLDQLEERLVSTDRDMTQVARKVAEGEYRLRQSHKQLRDETAELAQRLAHLQTLLSNSAEPPTPPADKQDT